MEIRKITPHEVEVRCQLSDIKIEQRSEESEGRIISGYAAKFDTWSSPIMGWFIEQIRKGSFDECDTSDAIMCFNHNVDDILARTSSGTLTLTIDNVGLHFSFDAPNTTTGNNMVEHLRRGDVNKCSFRFIVEQDEWIYADGRSGDTEKVYDKRTITKISKLYDVALVVYPAYKDTDASVRKLEERKAAYLENVKDDKPEENPTEGVEGTDRGEETPAEEQTEEQPVPTEAVTRSQSRERLSVLLKLKL